MSFAIKLDENLSIAHVDLLRQGGYDADRVDEQDYRGRRMSKYGNAFVPTVACSSLLISISPTYASISRAPIPAFF